MCLPLPTNSAPNNDLCVHVPFSALSDDLLAECSPKWKKNLFGSNISPEVKMRALHFKKEA